MCDLCHKEAPLVVDHLISIDEMRNAGFDKKDYNGDWNLAALCDECNSGKSNLPMPLNVLLSIVMRRLRALNDPRPE